jgi:DNA repair photolyase
MTEFYDVPRWTGEILDCSLPLTFDQYSNCSYGCRYCFSANQRGINKAAEGYLGGVVRPVNVERVKAMWEGRVESQFLPYIQSGRAFQWGGLSDPFCEFERRFGVGLELLRFFAKRESAICFSTKGAWWTEDPRYVEAFDGQKRWNVKVSIITLDDRKARVIERGVPSPSERLRAIERIARWNAGGATLRLRPFLIGASEPRHVELIRAAADAGATAVSTEFFCLEQRSPVLRKHMPVLNKVLGFDLLAFYRQYSDRKGYLRLNKNLKRPFVDEMEAECKARGLRFYVSDPDFKERSANGSCCGLPPDWPYARGQFTEALVIARERGEVSWSDLEPHLDYAQFNAVRAHYCQLVRSSSGRIAQFKHMTMAEAIRWHWNNPESGNSPWGLYRGVLRPDRLDEQGNLIYVYDSSRT